jgi:hypothetical protein
MASSGSRAGRRLRAAAVGALWSRRVPRRHPGIRGTERRLLGRAGDDHRLGDIDGTEGDDVIVGSGVSDTIDGGGGGDLVCGLGGMTQGQAGAAGGRVAPDAQSRFWRLEGGMCARLGAGSTGPPCSQLTPCLEAETLAPRGVALEPGCRL